MRRRVRYLPAVFLGMVLGGSVLRAAEGPAEAPAADPAPTPSGSASVLEEGLFPKSFRIPGTNVSVAFGGYAKVDFIQDFDPVGNFFEFKTDTIAIEGTPEADQEGQTTLHARETRLSIDFRSIAPKGAKFRAYFEGDFFGDNGSFRMRHGYGEFGRVLGGQTWTTFMDFSARPLTVDYEGPDAEVFVRQAMIRYTQPLSRHWTWAIAVENTGSQIDNLSALAGSGRSDLPDVPTYFRFEKGRGHVQIAAIFRQIRFDGTGGAPDLSETGWGVNGTFKYKVYKQDELMGQIAHGEGIGRYIESFSGLNADAVITPASELELLPATAMVLGYTHHWRDDLKSGISFARATIDPDPSQPGTTTEKTSDGRLNLIWTPYRQVDYAGEVLWGTHETVSGAEGEAWRLQFAIIFRFN